MARYKLVNKDGTEYGELKVGEDFISLEGDVESDEVDSQLDFINELKQRPQWKEFPMEAFLEYYVGSGANAYSDIQLYVIDDETEDAEETSET